MTESVAGFKERIKGIMREREAPLARPSTVLGPEHPAYWIDRKPRAYKFSGSKRIGNDTKRGKKN